MRSFILTFSLLILLSSSYSQSVSSGQNYDVYFYNLDLKIDPEKKHIEGSNEIYFKALSDFDSLKIDLYANLEVSNITANDQALSFRRDSNSIYIKYTGKKESRDVIKISYSGNPVEAKNPPWDGGFIWTQDSSNYYWVGVACQGEGASLWWPCKDDFFDEPDSMRMTFKVPQILSCISNGTLKRTEPTSKGKIFEWFVNYPINTYNVTLNIGNYVSWRDSLMRKDGTLLPLEYYVLENNLEKAKKHFQQVKLILSSYEKLFGKYPFEKDGYALVETPYWGMEHQSAIAYGNNYEKDLIDFDFIIVHETAHEWFGNSLTAPDLGELWIHESFATYAEALLIEDRYGYEMSLKYLMAQKKKILNKQALMLPKGTFKPEDTDIYYKGSWVLHTLRNYFNNDSLWFRTLRKLATEHKLSIITTDEIIAFFEKESGKDLSAFFDQYLRHTALPILEYFVEQKNGFIKLHYRWKAEVPELRMPVFIQIKEQKIRLQASGKWRYQKFKNVQESDIRFWKELQLIETERKNENK